MPEPYANTFCTDFGVDCPHKYTKVGPLCKTCFIQKQGSKIKVITREIDTMKEKKKNYIQDALISLSTVNFRTADDIEALYVFRNGQYEPGEVYVKARLEKMFGDETNSGMCAEVINHLKRRSYVPRELFNQFKGSIPVENGLLNLETGVLSEPQPDNIFTFKIQAKYDPDKKCLKWLKFMEEVLPEEEDRLSVQEYAGYSLLPRMPYHKIAFLVGDGRNGKGAFIRTIQSILGINNVANIRIDHLSGGHRFAATNLYGKLMNVSSEPSIKWPLQTELLKQLTGEDWFDGEVKGKQNPVRFQPFSKHFVLANKLPKVNDNSTGWWDRVLIVMWKQTFTDEKGNQIVNIEDSWLSEEDDRSGIFNWLIEGWVRLNANKRFTQSKTQRDAMIQFKRASDPIGAFLAEACVYGPEFYEPRDGFYLAYKDYAMGINASPEGNRAFFDRIRDSPGLSLDKKRRVRGASERVVLGVKLLEESEAGADGADGAYRSPQVKLIIEREGKDGYSDHAPSAPSAPPSNNIDNKVKCVDCGAPNASVRFRNLDLCSTCMKARIKGEI